MSANQKIPKGPLAVAIFFILLFFIEVIVVVSVTPNMPPVFWLIGVFFLILGISIYIYLYRKYKNGAYKETVQTETTTFDQGISDKTQRSYTGIRIISFLTFIDCLVGGIFMLSRPYFGAYFGAGVYGYIGAGYGDQGLGIAASIFMIFCALFALIIIVIPHRLKRKHIINGVILSLLVFILGLAGLGMAYEAFAGYQWWPESGFFASVIPSMIAFLLFLIILIKIKK